MFLLIKPEREEIYEKTSLNNSINKIYDATVLIETYNGSTLKNTGTGFFYKKDDKYAYILTNEHVISEGIKIEIVNSKDEKIEATVIGKDEYLDLAVLKVDKKYAKKIAIIGNSKDTKLGDTVFTVGSPLGYEYRGSVTSGILSGKNRKVKVETNNEDWIMKVIQVDASLNPGNSGGPLLDVKGEVIGIVSLKLLENNVEGMGFAIPIEYAMNYIEYLENNEKIKYPELGVKTTDSTDTTTLLKNNININQPQDGVVVLETKGRLRKGDLIIKVSNNEIYDSLTLKCELYQYKVKDKVELIIIRNGLKRKAIITLS
ncbi:MAG: serine protease [Bacilli bacterium]|nr:serine protease [Bacilli bacterium]